MWPLPPNQASPAILAVRIQVFQFAPQSESACSHSFRTAIRIRCVEATVPLYILAGGRSSRFGSDKALADVGGRSLLARVAEQWQPWATSPILVADRPDKYPGFAVIADRQPGLGPMGGLLTALEHCTAEWLILAACDTLLLDPQQPASMLAARTDAAQVVALRGEENEAGRWQPLPGLYRRSLLPLVTASLARKQASLWRLIQQVPHQSLAAGELARINTPEDLQAYLCPPRNP